MALCDTPFAFIIRLTKLIMEVSEMTKEKFNKNYDVFHSFLVENADYEGRYKMPKIKTSDRLPKKVITFSKAMSKG